jgi:thiamine pyrophosphate-dependent acetolactate synthase large subunit-like protein
MRFQQERSALLYCLPVIQGKEPLSCETFFDAMRRSLPDDACIAIDAGYHQMLGRQFLRVKSVRGLIVPSDFQSMGFAIPAAVGAAVAVPHRKTLALVGDGGMAITGLELLTAVRENLNLTVIVFNDGYLGLIRRNQIENSGREHAVRLQNPDFEMLAGAIGANYFTLDNSPDVVFHQCFNTPGVNLLEVFLNDAPSMRRSRIRGLARSAVRKTIPPSQFGRLKKLLHRC